MLVHLDAENPVFPPADRSLDSGLLAFGGNLHPQTLLKAYRSGIFPWYSPEDDILWWSPPIRCIFPIGGVKVSKSTRQTIRKTKPEVRFDTNFEGVIKGCQQTPRPGQDGTWIDDAMLNAYIELHKMGYAHSVETWQGDRLVGGLYGLALGRCFIGESMFSTVSNSSKIALAVLDRFLLEAGYGLLDCQIYNDHLGSLGAINIPRQEYLRLLSALVDEPPILPWPKGQSANFSKMGL